MKNPKFLVIGNAVNETVRRNSDASWRSHAGGVAAIMARELALAGADATILTTAPEGAPTKRLRNMLERNNVTCHIIPGNPPQHDESTVTIHVQNGQPAQARGKWARMGGILQEITDMAPEYDMVLMSMNLSKAEMQTALQKAPKLVANATTTKNAPKLLDLKGQFAATMNQHEMEAVMATMGRGDPTHMPEHLEAEHVLITSGARGKTLIQRGQKAHWTPAVPVPQHTDFIGAGDAATAGLAYALAHELPLTQTIDQFITSILQRNAEGYR